MGPPPRPQSMLEKLASPKDFFHSLYHRFMCMADSALQLPMAQGAPQLASYVEGDPSTDRELCCRAMALVYDLHAGTIGKVQGAGGKWRWGWERVMAVLE